MILSLGLNDFVDKPVCKSFVGGHIVVALGVKFNAGNGLAGARGKYSIQLFANAQDLFGMNLNIRCLPLCAAGGLMYHDFTVGQGAALTLCASSKQEYRFYVRKREL